MIPEYILSSEAIVGPFRYWLRGERLPHEDMCRGGIAVNNSSQGMDVQIWKGRLKGDGTVTVASEFSGYNVEFAFHKFDATKSPTKLSVAFDNNMTPCATAQLGRDCEFYWYDGTLPGYRTLYLLNTRDAIARVDDVRDSALLSRDIVLSYIRDDVLYYRLSRERFLIERALYTLHNWQTLYQCGMTERLRFKWEFVWDSDRVRSCT